jgi:hypothetical protein
MGLDITYFSKARRVSDDDEDAWSVYRSDGCADHLNGKPEGRYHGEDLGYFRAGSYYGYNEWRRWLSQKFIGAEPSSVWADPKKYADKPFVELVNYSDCEGAFGPQSSAKLFADFFQHVKELGPQDDTWNISLYFAWMRAFEVARDDGFVILH